MHHLIGGSSPAPFCSTPGPANSFASSSLEVDGTVARKTASKDVLEVGQLTAKNFPSPPDMSPCNPLDEHRQDCRQHQFQSSGLNKPIGAGKKWSKYSKRLSRLFRHDNMILNRSYMELVGAGDAKGALFKICGQTDYKSFSQLLFLR
uniref:Uncharacterized protein n=1 Tax=Trichobilharzia regenti TaxID=157069 RepID=A0AA85JN42_TRIRE|nr:unnamed protein product [Trichobilharzia regenti]